MDIVYKTTTNEPIQKTVNKTVTKSIKQTKILIKDKYSFPIELKYDDNNEYVKNLQIIMRSY